MGASAMAFIPETAKNRIQVEAGRFRETAIGSTLYYQERLEGMIGLNLIRFEDIAMPTKYYCQKMIKYIDLIRCYAIDTGYGNAMNFIDKFQEEGKEKIPG